MSFRPEEWNSMRAVARYLSYFTQEKVYRYVDGLGDALSEAQRVQFLREALRALRAKGKPVPPQEDVERVINLLLDRRRGREAGSIIASLALTSYSVEGEEKKEKGGES